ncbi:hypothetical protein [Streptomyces sp. NRRL F-5123]|uniref:hypothetical protein n=1 Tax=Streptomyces sp. NRRL F-5123 TaxID=1463856 RepID=UPI0004E12D44|nr:hypothetical protein [Streptomyces sp. NRRL F-5123]
MSVGGREQRSREGGTFLRRLWAIVRNPVLMAKIVAVVVVTGVAGHLLLPDGWQYAFTALLGGPILGLLIGGDAARRADADTETAPGGPDPE